MTRRASRTVLSVSTTSRTSPPFQEQDVTATAVGSTRSGPNRVNPGRMSRRPQRQTSTTSKSSMARQDELRTRSRISKSQKSATAKEKHDDPSRQQSPHTPPPRPPQQLQSASQQRQLDFSINLNKLFATGRTPNGSRCCKTLRPNGSAKQRSLNYDTIWPKKISGTQ